MRRTFRLSPSQSQMRCFTDMSHIPLPVHCTSVFHSDYDSLRKEDVFENNRLVRCQLVEPLSY